MSRRVAAHLLAESAPLLLALSLGLLFPACGSIGPTGSNQRRGPPVGGSTPAGVVTPDCAAGAIGPGVQEPELVVNLPGQTGWFAAPLVFDLDGDGENELIAAYYSLYIFDSEYNLIAEIDGGGDRVYAPHVVADLEGDGVVEIVYAGGSRVHAYEWRDGEAVPKSGWPADTTVAGSSPEVRGMAAGDLNGDGSLEIVATTTQTADTDDGGAQLFVYNFDGSLYQPTDISWNAWPRYNNQSGEGNDADRNGQGHTGYGAFGLNVAIGNIDDNPDLEILATYDNHFIQAFRPDGVAIDASPWFTNRASEYLGQRLTWGQFIRWDDLEVEEAHYHTHEGEWPHPSTSAWLQWTASPPHVVDLDQDGKNEVLGVPNVELHEPYETQSYAIMVLEGAHGDGSRSAMRKAGWEVLPRGGFPVQVDGWYPPGGVPAAALVDIDGDDLPEIVVSLNDKNMYAFDSDGSELWRYDYSHGKTIMYSSEPVVADLNQDANPEILFTTYGDPSTTDSGNLVILSSGGTLLHGVPLPEPGTNGNGNGAPAAPTVADLDGDGQLEVFVQTFEHGMDVFTIPGSSTNCMLWPTARGGPLRMGQPNTN